MDDEAAKIKNVASDNYCKFLLYHFFHFLEAFWSNYKKNDLEKTPHIYSIV